MAITKKHSSSDDDFTRIGSDATATFDNSASNPTEHASSENLNATDVDDEDSEDEELDEEEEEYDEEDDDEEYEDDDNEEEEDEDDDEDDDDDDDEDDLAKGPKAPSVYRKL